MSFISRFKYPAAALTVGFFLLLEIAVRLLPSVYGEGAGIFLAENRARLADSSQPEFDYIILGDSRSMSLMGHAPTASEPYSLYNFSMPAMGAKYYTFFLKKIIKNRKHPPVAVILAVEPQTYFASYRNALHDPEGRYSETAEADMGTYLKNRVTGRVRQLLKGRNETSSSPRYTTEMIWDAFSHRYLHFFTIGEIMGNYQGPERVFLVKEAIPMLYYTYRYRDAIRSFPSMIKSYYSPLPPDLPLCSTCEGVRQQACHPRMSHWEDNRKIEKGLRARYGQINLSDRLSPGERASYLAIREAQVADSIKVLNSIGEPDFFYLKEFITAASREGVKVIVTDVPSIEAYRDTVYHKVYFKMLEKLLENDPDAVMIRFSQPYYPLDLFVEQIHYDCPGAVRLNRDFYNDVMPKIIQYAPYLNDGRARAFRKTGE